MDALEAVPFKEKSDLVKFVMCTLVSRVHIPFYKLFKGYTVPGNQSAHDKLNQFEKVNPSSNLCTVKGVFLL